MMLFLACTYQEQTNQWCKIFINLLRIIMISSKLLILAIDMKIWVFTKLKYILHHDYNKVHVHLFWKHRLTLFTKIIILLDQNILLWDEYHHVKLLFLINMPKLKNIFLFFIYQIILLTREPLNRLLERVY